MINKIKDFLNQLLRRKRPHDFSDQDEIDADSTQIEVASRPDFLEQESSYEKPNFKSQLLGLVGKIKSSFSGSKGNGSRKSSSEKSEGHPLLSPSLTRSIEKILSRSSREPIHQIALVVLVCAITYTLGKVTAFVMRGPPALDSAKEYTVAMSLDENFNVGTLNQVKSINIFRTNSGLGATKKVLADKKCEKADSVSALPIKLVNTIVLQDSVKSLASVQIRGDRDLQEAHEGDQISNMARVFKITRLEILIKNLESGACESIASDKAKEARSPISVLSPAKSMEFKANKKMSGIDNMGNKFVISKVLLDEKMKDIGAILTQARALKIQNPDGSLSFKMTELDPAGIFPYLGIQDSDIITSINGKPIYDMNEVMGLFGRIKGLDNLSLGIKREGADATQEYAIKK